ncbi:unnamed protein product [Allacma fusca]|uniref:BBSome-interacting protein 1 n=1 Tax=Allacma fusca TaxID=39272 RepID=A0A8J2PLY7_9HEXA|nr:unnamed protein product [Allacma fusca]
MSSATSTRLTKSTKSSAKTIGGNTSDIASMREILPKKGYLHCEDSLTFVLCKPKLLPLKSSTVEKLEKIQQEAVEKAKQEMNATSLD